MTSDGWVELILGRLSVEAERSPTVRRRLVYALSCLLRGHSRSQQEFAKAGGYSRLAGLAAEAHSSGDAAMATKATVLLADLAAEEGKEGRAVRAVQESPGTFCPALASMSEDLSAERVDGVERLAPALRAFAAPCAEWLRPGAARLLRLAEEVERVGREDEDLDLEEAVAGLREAADEVANSAVKGEL